MTRKKSFSRRSKRYTTFLSCECPAKNNFLIQFYLKKKYVFGMKTNFSMKYKIEITTYKRNLATSMNS